MLLSQGDQVINASEYLLQLLKDRQQLTLFPNTFVHIGRLLDTEINRVRSNAFYLGMNAEPLQLPEPLGPIITLTEKLNVPTKDYPDFNFVGRLLGPRGLTAKQLELDTGCKILIRGQGSMRDKHKEMQMKGKAKWEHLNEDLHVLVSVEDSKNRATIRLKKAVEEVKKLLLPVPESEDELKKRQLTELAVLNGTFRGLTGGILLAKTADMNQNVLVSPPPMLLPNPNPSPIFVTGGPIFHGAMGHLQSPTPLTPISSPGMHPQSLFYHQALPEFLFSPSAENSYEYNPIQHPLNNTAFAH